MRDNPSFATDRVSGPVAGRIWKATTSNGGAGTLDLAAITATELGLTGDAVSWVGCWVRVRALTADVNYYMQDPDSSVAPTAAARYNSNPTQQSRVLVAGTSDVFWVEEANSRIRWVGAGAGILEIERVDF